LNKEEASKEVSRLKKEVTRTWWINGLMEIKGAPRMFGPEGSSDPRLFQGLMLLLDLNILLYMCV
jgi:hypothetical protein